MANPYTPEVTLRKFIDRSYQGIFEDDAVTSIGNYKLQYIEGITKIFMTALTGSTNTETFTGCSSLQYIILPSVGKIGPRSIYNCPALIGADFGTNCNNFDVYSLQKCSSLTTLVLRRTSSICTAFGQSLDNTPFASGGSGGTIYIPKALYDHLGDGTSLDYKAATNWSTYDASGNITWAKIEGSYYETHYVDGTLIPTS